MVRPRKVNKEAMTTAAVSEKLVKEMNLLRPASRSIGDFLNQVFQEWKTRKVTEDSYSNLKKENEFLVETLEQHQRKIQEYVETINAMEKDQIALEKRLEIING